MRIVRQPQNHTLAVRLTTALAAISHLEEEWKVLVSGKKNSEIKYRVLFYAEVGALLTACASPNYGTKFCVVALITHALVLHLDSLNPVLKIYEESDRDLVCKDNEDHLPEVSSTPSRESSPLPPPIESPLPKVVDSDLFSAISDQNLNQIQLVLKAGVNVNAVNEKGETPLHIAAKINNPDIVDLLLKKGAEVDARTSDDKTPLHLAVGDNRPTVSSISMKAEKCEEEGLFRKYKEIAYSLVKDLNQRKTVQILVRKGADVNAVDVYDETAFHMAARRYDFQIIKCLQQLKHNTHVDTKNFKGNTPLFLAIKNRVFFRSLVEDDSGECRLVESDGPGSYRSLCENQQLTIEALVNSGANVNVKNHVGDTPLHVAIQYENTDAGNFLNLHRARADIGNQSGETPLHRAAARDLVCLLNTTIFSRRALRLKDNNGWTPLHHAVRNWELDSIKDLIEWGASVDELDNDGNTPLGNLLCAKDWRDCPADLETQDDVIEYMLEQGADINHRNKDGKTLVHLALGSHHSVALDIFLKKEIDWSRHNKWW